MTRRSQVFLAALFITAATTPLLLHVRSARAAAPTAVPFAFTTFDAPGAGSTMVVGINNLGDIVGSFNPIPGAAAYGLPSGFLGSGFIRHKNGTFVPVPGPGPNANGQSCNPLQGGLTNCYYMEVRGINDQGDIVGAYSQDVLNADGGLFRAFFQKQSGKFTSYLAPGHANSIFEKIEDTGIIYGCFHDEGIDNSSQASMHGVINFLTPGNSIQNLYSDSEDSSMITGGGPATFNYAGVFYDTTELRHRAFVVNAGHRTDFDVPGSNMTNAWDMNVEGDVVGVWGDNPNPIIIDGYPFHGFLRDRTGRIIDIEYPGSTDTHVFGINDLGVIVGSYVDTSNNVHGFIATPGNWTAEAANSGRVPVLNAAYAKGTSPKKVVAMMRIIPAGKPLLKASPTPACHHMGMAHMGVAQK